MRSDIKAGVIVGVLLVAAVVFFLVGRNQDAAETPEAPPTADVSGPAETSQEPEEPAPPAESEASEPAEPSVFAPPTPPDAAPPAGPDSAAPAVPVEPPAPEAEPAPEVPVPEPAEPREPRYHTVEAGDTLSEIAEMWYGSGKHWTVILEANKSLIRDPNKLHEGWRLRIPYPEEVASQP